MNGIRCDLERLKQLIHDTTIIRPNVQIATIPPVWRNSFVNIHTHTRIIVQWHNFIDEDIRWNQMQRLKRLMREYRVSYTSSVSGDYIDGISQALPALIQLVERATLQH